MVSTVSAIVAAAGPESLHAYIKQAHHIIGSEPANNEIYYIFPPALHTPKC
jgi:hypothetical protein